MHKAIGTVVMRAKSEGISKGLLLVCKRTRFGEQKDSFWSVKGLVLTLTDFTLHFSCCFTKLLHSHFIPLLNNFTC